MTGWTALVLAGSRPGVDPFAASHGTDLKALIPIDGEPMVRRPVRALLACPNITRVRVLTQQPERIGAVLPADLRLTVESSGDTIAASLAAICADPLTVWPLLVTTADHALLDEAMIADLRAGPMEPILPSGWSSAAILPVCRRPSAPDRISRRALQRRQFVALGSPRASRRSNFGRGVEQDRKKGWHLLAALGPAGLLGLLRLRSLDQTVASIGRRFLSPACY